MTDLSEFLARHVALIDPNVIVARKLDMLPVEIVVRDYMTGSTETSIWPMYQRGERQLCDLGAAGASIQRSEH